MKIKKLLLIELILLIPILAAFSFSVYKEYKASPGIPKKLEVSDKSANSITLKWDPVRNTDKYIVSYKEKNSDNWDSVTLSGNRTTYTLENLKEGTEYDFSLQANSEEREGSHLSLESDSTKKYQKISGKTSQMKLAGERKIDLDSETDIKLSSDDEEVDINEDQSLDLQPGTITIKAVAEETEDFEGDETEIELEVLDSVEEETDEADVHVMYTLDKSNCDVALTLKDSDIPQSFDYTEGKYIISYGMKNAHRIVTYDESGKSEYRTKMSLGHANGMAYSDKIYSVRGFSTSCVSCDMETDECESFNLPYGTSGIAYDKERRAFYTSSRTMLAKFDENFNEEMAITPIHRRNAHYAQDCGACNGIMMKCVSGNPKHGTNYVDLYDMVNGLYLGTVECDLSEVESATVDEKGYMLLLCNNSGSTDYIYKTPVNIRDLGNDL